MAFLFDSRIYRLLHSAAPLYTLHCFQYIEHPAMHMRVLIHTAIARHASADYTQQSISSDGSLSAITIPIVFGTIGAVFALIAIIVGVLQYRRTASRNIARDLEAQPGRTQDRDGLHSAVAPPQ